MEHQPTSSVTDAAMTQLAAERAASILTWYAVNNDAYEAAQAIAHLVMSFYYQGAQHAVEDIRVTLEMD